MEDNSESQLFDDWNDKKKMLSKRKNIPHFKEGEIWWCSCGQNLGIEMNGGEEFMRPILIMRKFDGRGFMGMYISKQPHVGSWFARFEFRGRTQYALVNQVKTSSALRLQTRIGQIGGGALATIRLQFRKLYIDKN